jgi:hypothetical protein
MARLGFADRDDLVQWGRSQGAPADLPDLVRQLILETTPGVAPLGFATGVGVYWLRLGWRGQGDGGRLERARRVVALGAVDARRRQ